MYMAWYVEKYIITFKLFINHWTNEILQHSLKVSHPRCVVKIQYVKKILFCTK